MFVGILWIFTFSQFWQIINFSKFRAFIVTFNTNFPYLLEILQICSFFTKLTPLQIEAYLQ